MGEFNREIDTLVNQMDALSQTPNDKINCEKLDELKRVRDRLLTIMGQKSGYMLAKADVELDKPCRPCRRAAACRAKSPPKSTASTRSSPKRRRRPRLRRPRKRTAERASGPGRAPNAGRSAPARSPWPRPRASSSQPGPARAAHRADPDGAELDARKARPLRRRLPGSPGLTGPQDDPTPRPRPRWLRRRTGSCSFRLRGKGGGRDLQHLGNPGGRTRDFRHHHGAIRRSDRLRLSEIRPSQRLYHRQ